MHEFILISKQLAPFESDGAEDKEEWNLFEEYLPKDFINPQSLSGMLNRWIRDSVSYRDPSRGLAHLDSDQG